MAGAQHHHTLACIALAMLAKDVRNSIEDLCCRRRFTDREDATGPHRTGVGPGARRVDDRASEKHGFALFRLDAKLERRLVASFRLYLVETEPADRCHSMT